MFNTIKSLFPLPSVQLAKQGHSKQEVLAALINHFHLPREMHEAARVHKYYILHWQGKYLKDKVHLGMIEDEGMEYAVVYKARPSDIFKAAQVAISFRSTELGNFALVRIINEDR